MAGKLLNLKRMIVIVAGVLFAALAASAVTAILVMLYPSADPAAQWGPRGDLEIARLFFIACVVGGLLLCLPLVMLITKLGWFRWWSCVGIGAFVYAAPQLGPPAKDFLAAVATGAAGGLMFYPFWRWAERLRVAALRSGLAEAAK